MEIVKDSGVLLIDELEDGIHYLPFELRTP